MLKVYHLSTGGFGLGVQKSFRIIEKKCMERTRYSQIRCKNFLKLSKLNGPATKTVAPERGWFLLLLWLLLLFVLIYLYFYRSFFLHVFIYLFIILHEGKSLYIHAIACLFCRFALIVIFASMIHPHIYIQLSVHAAVCYIVYISLCVCVCVCVCTLVFVQEPFPLYPGEVLAMVPGFGTKAQDYTKALQRMPVVPVNCALRLRALVDHTSDDGEHIPAGHLWQVEGPMTYAPRPEVVGASSMIVAASLDSDAYRNFKTSRCFCIRSTPQNLHQK